MTRLRPSLAVSLLLAGLAVALPATAALLLLRGGLGGLLGSTGALPIASAIGWLVSLVGLSLYVVLPSLSHETAVKHYASYRTMLATLAFAAIPANLLSLVYVLTTGRSGGGTAEVLGLSVLLLELSLLGALYLRIVGPGVLSWRELGFSLERVRTEVPLGLGTALGLIVVMSLEQALLRAIGVEQTQAQMFEGVRGAPLWQFGLLFVGAVVLAPLAEEAFFRGYVITACLRTKGVWQAYLFSAGLFALVHLNLPALLPIFTIGLGFAFVYVRTRSLVPTVVAHAFNNGVALLALYFAPML